MGLVYRTTDTRLRRKSSGRDVLIYGVDVPNFGPEIGSLVTGPYLKFNIRTAPLYKSKWFTILDNTPLAPPPPFNSAGQKHGFWMLFVSEGPSRPFVFCLQIVWLWKHVGCSDSKKGFFCICFKKNGFF